MRSLAPKMDLLAEVDFFAVIATAPGKQVDFVSRFFAPRVGVRRRSGDRIGSLDAGSLLGKAPEAAHAARPAGLFAEGGSYGVRIAGNRVIIRGNSVKYLEGFVEI